MQGLDQSITASAPGRVNLDLAKGIIMAWCRCTEREAFDEISTASREHGVSVTRLARELVWAVAGTRAISSECSRAISERWGNHLDLRAPSTSTLCALSTLR